jgi:C1A family cysteine protease
LEIEKEYINFIAKY